MEPLQLTPELFQAALGTKVRVLDLDVDLEIVKVDVKEGDRPDNAYSVEFTGPVEPALEQRIYRLEHETIGSVDLFLVPVAGDADGYTYEAVFTSLKT